jgi:hypothetical protein
MNKYTKKYLRAFQFVRLPSNVQRAEHVSVLFICGLFNDTASSTDYIVSNILLLRINFSELVAWCIEKLYEYKARQTFEILQPKVIISAIFLIL